MLQLCAQEAALNYTSSLSYIFTLGFVRMLSSVTAMLTFFSWKNELEGKEEVVYICTCLGKVLKFRFVVIVGHAFCKHVNGKGKLYCPFTALFHCVTSQKVRSNYKYYCF